MIKNLSKIIIWAIAIAFIIIMFCLALNVDKSHYLNL